jgi:hypothetical protein
MEVAAREGDSEPKRNLEERKTMTDSDEHNTGRGIVLAFYADADRAQAALETLMDQDFPLDRVSVLGRASSSGDDPLGVYYPGIGERMKGWGRMGALWGGIWGLVTGAAGLFLVPGTGAVLVAGPLVEALAGGAAGAGVGGGALAGGAALSHLAVAAHRMGVPEERLEETRQLIHEGHHLLLLIADAEEVPGWRKTLEPTGPNPLWDFPYTGVHHAVAAAASR